MTLDALKSLAERAKNIANDAANAIFNSSFIKNIGQGLQYIGKTLYELIQKIASFVVVFFKENIPHYFNIVKDYAKIGLDFAKKFAIDALAFIKSYSLIALDYIRNNKQPIAIGAGIGALATLAACSIYKCATKEEDEV